jgi:predicted PurR-regulated permease PerM
VTEPRQPIIPPWLRRFGRVWGFALFLVFVLVVFRAVVLPFVLGTLVAYILAPVVSALSAVGKPGMPRWVSVLLVYLGIAAALAGFVMAFAGPLSADFARLFREAPRFFAHVKKDYVPRADAWLEANFPQEAPPEADESPRPERKLVVSPQPNGKFEVSLENLELELEPMGGGRYVVGPRSDSDEKRPRLADLVGRAVSATQSEFTRLLDVGRRWVASLFKAFAWFVLTFMVAAYLLVDLSRVMAFLRSLVPEQQRTGFDDLVAEMNRGLSGVIRGQLIICVVNGVLTTVGLLIFHVKFALLLGCVAGMMSFIPVFGSILSSVPIVAVALTSGPAGFSLSTGLGMLGWIVGIHLLEANFQNPKIIGSAAKMHPVVVVFALLVGEESGGLIGALLAVPIASIVQAIFLYFRRRQALAAAADQPTPSSA